MDIGKRLRTGLIKTTIRAIITAFMLALGVNNQLTAENNKIPDIQISPAEVFFKSEQQAANIKIKNLSNSKIYLKAKLLKWGHGQNQNSYINSNDLFVNSELLSIDANKEQSISIQKSKAFVNTKATTEQSYRLMLSMIDISANPKSKTNKAALNNLSMPIFVSPITQTNLPIQWSKKILGDDSLELSVYNPNNSHKIIDKITIKNKLDNDLYQQDNANIYLLANQKYTMHFKLDKEQTKNSDLNNVKMVLNTANSISMIG